MLKFLLYEYFLYIQILMTVNFQRYIGSETSLEYFILHLPRNKNHMSQSSFYNNFILLRI